jgi:prolyl-tRNA editing enzyme YbaK/EbsC (Cys-tRNA(Pro) deacylase)
LDVTLRYGIAKQQLKQRFVGKRASFASKEAVAEALSMSFGRGFQSHF